MKAKLLLIAILITSSWMLYSGFTSGNDDPRWNQDPRTAVNMAADYVRLPNNPVEIKQFSTSPQMTNTPIGVMVTYPNVRVHPSGTNDYSQSEVPIVSSPANRNILFASSNAYVFSTGLINSGVYVSTDGGLNWTGTETLPGASTNDQRGDPGPTIDKNGVFLFTHLTSTTNFGFVTGMGANRSTNNGATWSTTIQVASDGGADKNLAGTDDSPSSPYYGNSYFAWTSFSTSPANGRVSRTTNSGLNWSTPLTINATPAGHNAQGHDVAVGPDGRVYVTWTAGVTSSPFTEDFVGLAVSTNGGTSYTATENIFDDNGSRSSSFNGWGIRTNGFPRIAIDKSGGVRNGWIYIVVSQLNLAPAGTDADVVIHRSTDNGVTWSAGIRVNQDALNNGKVQFFPAICVDSDGGVNVVYYDNRNFASSGDSCSVYISRSVDGGTTWGDVRISDHNFKPKQMSPFGGGYMGDYIGITQSVGKVVAVWMDDKAAPVGTNRPNCWAGALDISQPTICQDFASVTFPPTDFNLEQYTGTLYWTRQTPSAYASGSGSAKFDFWNASAGVTQSIVTDKFLPTAAGTYLTFDRAYSPWFSNRDSLIIESSTNGGNTFTNVARLWGDESGTAPLNTVPRISNFSPASGDQWRPTIFSLPAGTTKIRFKAVSGFGNNLYLDNICLQSLASPVASSIGLIIEGLFIPFNPYNFYPDTVKVYLARTDFPNIRVDSAKSILGGNAIVDNLFFNKALSGTYYRVVEHRNSIETWSNIGIGYARGSSSHHNFVPNGESYGNNMATVSISPFYKGQYSGDIFHDGYIDGSDVSAAENGASLGLSGYVQEDVTGDLFVDASDLSITENNLGVGIVAPPGAEPLTISENNITPEFSSDAVRQKYETAKKYDEQVNVKNNESEAKIKNRKELSSRRKNSATQLNNKESVNNNDQNINRVGEK